MKFCQFSVSGPNFVRKFFQKFLRDNAVFRIKQFFIGTFFVEISVFFKDFRGSDVLPDPCSHRRLVRMAEKAEEEVDGGVKGCFSEIFPLCGIGLTGKNFVTE